MPKPASVAALSLLLLAACGNGERTAEQNNAVGAEANAPDTSSALDPALPAAPVNEIADPVAPPDAVSHPNGFLPPAPAEAGTDAGGAPAADQPPPATEDEYIRNGQAGR
jgi:hypothetical protein